MSQNPTPAAASDVAPLSPKEAAEILNVDIKSIYGGMRRGEIPSMRLGRLFLIPRRAFMRLVDGGTA